MGFLQAGSKEPRKNTNIGLAGIKNQILGYQLKVNSEEKHFSLEALKK
jgi:hypothetical protein